MEYALAPSYRDYETVGSPYFKNGKMYTKARTKCDRCMNGVYICRVENGQPVPHPVADGVCFRCNGSGYISKEVRLYTVEEAEKMEKRNEAARIKREQEREAKMKAEFADNKRKWLEKNGWSQDETCWIIIGESYSIKEELKNAGFRYSPILKWYKNEFDEKYADRLLEIKLSEIAQWSAWGEASFNIDAQKIINEKIAKMQPQSTSTWIGKIGDKLKGIKVKLTSKYNFETRYGVSTIYNFEDEEGNVLVWFSSTIQEVEPGEWCTIKSCTIKDHSEYKNVKQTILTRCSIKE